ncbi:serine/threonine/tyrosine-interacting protein B-like [Lytechinus variegatus]|uniref:serine/threonine/tyrosine-interacting protein B-like n=1 Tax=Lytechinus variegatus TaxID=7654 RepID=UPI001BB24FAF|nr:serine/threonine/tyrosine-interacting protein B-like [Lytechinus variegatus]
MAEDTLSTLLQTLKFPQIPTSDEEPRDWVYTRRREMQEILPGLYLGPYAAAQRSKLPVLLEHGITHVLCIRQAPEATIIKPNFPDRFQYLVLDVADNALENIIRHIPTVKGFIDSCLQSGGRILVHGNAGISRSAALVIGYLMETYGLKYRIAYRFVQEKRFCISVNDGFASQLKEYEAIFTARMQVHSGMTERLDLKRPLDDEEMEPD